MGSLPVIGNATDFWMLILHPLALLGSLTRFRRCLLLFVCSFLGIFHVDCLHILSEFLTGNRVESFQNQSFWKLPRLLLLFTCSVVSDSATPWMAAHRPPCPPMLASAQTHVHWVSNAIQPAHPLSSPSPPAFSLPQHQGLFFSIRGHSIGASVSVLPMNI